MSEEIRRRPYCVVLLDEIEKAHPDVFHILLQIFDDGRLTDSKGRTVNCKNALFLMTSNVGSTQILEKEALDKELLLKIIQPLLLEHFRPEFLNRLDDILPFLPLEPKDMSKIALLQLTKTAKRLQEKSITLSWNDEVLAYLAEKGYEPSFGARPLKRLIQKEVTNLLASAVLQGSIESGNSVQLFLMESKGEKKISYQKKLLQ